MVKIVPYKTNYTIDVDDIKCEFHTDFSVGDGQEYDFTVDECVEADMNEIRTAFYNDDKEISDEDFLDAMDKIRNYYENHNN